MATGKITIRALDGLEPGATLWDAGTGAVQGFGARRQAGDVVSFILKYRIQGRQRLLTLGTLAQIKPEQAREAASIARGHVAMGIDPAETKADAKAERAKERDEEKYTFEKVARKYIKRVAKKNLRAWDEVERIHDRYTIPAWGKRAIVSISRRDVTELLDRLEDKSGLVMADRVLAQVRRLFNWHALQDATFNSPVVKGMARVKPREIARDRVFTDAELRAFWVATASTVPADLTMPRRRDSKPAPDKYAVPYPFGRLCRFLLLTAQRRDEAGMATWPEIEDTVWTIPGERYKTKISNVVPLSPQALAQIADMPVIGEDQFVFTVSGKGAFNGFSKAKLALDKAMLTELRRAAGEDAKKVALPGWRLHDLRRTAKTLMSRSGVRGEISERVLGHIIAGVEGTYDRHGYLDEKRDALARLANTIDQIVTPLPQNVVQLAAKRG